MLAWLGAHLATIVICAVLAALVALVIVYMIRNKRKGKSSCGCGCGGCPMNGNCHSQK